MVRGEFETGGYAQAKSNTKDLFWDYKTYMVPNIESKHKQTQLCMTINPEMLWHNGAKYYNRVVKLIGIMLCSMPDNVPSSRGWLGDHRALEDRCSGGHPTTVNSVCQITQIHQLHSQSLVSERFRLNLSVTVYLMPGPNRLIFSETRVHFHSINIQVMMKAKSILVWIFYESTLAAGENISGQHCGLRSPLGDLSDGQIYSAGL